MIKLIHKKHLSKPNHKGNIVIYYSTFDIVIGIALMSLVIFFIHDYLSHTPGGSDYPSPHPFIVNTLPAYRQ